MLDEFKRVDAPTERRRLHCATCKRLTIHQLEARCSGSWDDRHNGEGGGAHYSIYRCGACDAVCYETRTWSSYELEYDEDNEPYNPEYAIQYPPPVSAHFNFNTQYTPGRLDDILDEMLYALAGSKMTLATIGLRLAIEFIVKDKKCAGNNLQKKIDSLHQQGLVDEDQKDLLHLIRKYGNAGAHEASPMTSTQIAAAMSIIEGLLEKLYNGPGRHTETIRRAKKLLKEPAPSTDAT